MSERGVAGKFYFYRLEGVGISILSYFLDGFGMIS